MISVAQYEVAALRDGLARRALDVGDDLRRMLLAEPHVELEVLALVRIERRGGVRVKPLAVAPHERALQESLEVGRRAHREAKDARHGRAEVPLRGGLVEVRAAPTLRASRAHHEVVGEAHEASGAHVGHRSGETGGAFGGFAANRGTRQKCCGRQRPIETRMARREGSVFKGTLYMLALSVLLFWLPIAGPLIAGYVGGRRAGSAGRGAIAAILPAIVAGILVALAIAALPEVNLLIGAVFGSIAAIAIVLQSALLVLGGIVGGAMAAPRLRARRDALVP